jgi:hypothetical protein
LAGLAWAIIKAGWTYAVLRGEHPAPVVAT